MISALTVWQGLKALPYGCKALPYGCKACPTAARPAL